MRCFHNSFRVSVRACASLRQTYCAGRISLSLQKLKCVMKRLWGGVAGDAYLSVNFALLLQEDVRLGSQRHDVPDDRDGGRTGREARRPPLLDQLTDQQRDQQSHRQAEQPEQSPVPGRERQRRRISWNHLRRKA